MAARVLVVEDDEKFASLLVRAFDRAGMEAVHRFTGDAALRALQLEPPFDAAVLDVMIPHPDGLEVCRHLRKTQSTMGIVAISALVGAEHRTRARAAGADVFLAKPFPLQDLVAATSELIASPAVKPRPTRRQLRDLDDPGELRRFDLRGADLRKVPLAGADLTGLDLRRARLRRCDLEGAPHRSA